MKTIFACAVVTLSVSACVVIINNGIANKKNDQYVCDALPVLRMEPIPDVPYLPPKGKTNAANNETILVDKISELRSYAKRMQSQVNEANAAQLGNCKRL